MTEKERTEIKDFLRAKGFSTTVINTMIDLKDREESIEIARDSEEARRYQELRTFTPNPGTATLTEVGKVPEGYRYLQDANPGKSEDQQHEVTVLRSDGKVPIYKEDLELLEKSAPLARKLMELHEKRQDVGKLVEDAYDLPQGPDTTESINEVVEDPEQMDVEAGWHKIPDRVKQAILKSREVEMKQPPLTKEEVVEKLRRAKTLITSKAFNEKVEEAANNFKTPGNIDALIHHREIEVTPAWDVKSGTKENKETPDVMWYFDPESERFKPVIEHETEGPQGKDKIKESFEKTQEANICMGIRRDEEMTTSPYPFPGDKYSYSNILRNMQDTHTRKNADYGDAAYKGYKKYGDYYFLVQLSNKLSRLESLTVGNKKQQVLDESIDDTLLDLANYAVMYLESRHRND